MSVTGIGSQSSHWYNAQTNRLATKDGTKNAFVDFLNGGVSEEECGKRNGNQADMKNDIESLFVEKTTYSRDMKIRRPQTYTTFYEKDKIRCIRHDKDGFDWEIPLKDELQYNRVMAFLQEFEDKDSLPFTSHKNFWQDFLAEELDVEEFKNFLSADAQRTTADYVKVTEDGTYINREVMKYKKYMDPPDFVNDIFWTTEEFREWQKVQSKKAMEEWNKTHLSWVEQFNEEHPNLVGKKCLWWKGKLYTAEELDALWQEEIKDLFTQDPDEIW